MSLRRKNTMQAEIEELYAKNARVASAASGGIAPLLAVLENNVQHVGPYVSAGGVSTPALTVFSDSQVFTLAPSPIPGNATVDVKGSISVSGTATDTVVFTLVRDRGTASAQVLATQELSINTTGLVTSTLAILDTNVGTFPAGFIPLTELSSHTYSIVATAAHNLTGTEPVSIYMEQLPGGRTATVPAVPGGAVAMGSLLNFAGFGGAGVSTTPGTVQTSIQGSIGLGPGVTSTAFTGFGQAIAIGGEYATSPLVIADGATHAPYAPPPANQGAMYAADYAVPTPANVNTSYNDLLTAYTDASGRPAPAANTDVFAGHLGGQTLVPGVYKWNSPVEIGTAPPGNLTLNGAGVYIFIITGTFDLATAAQIILSGGASANNVFFAIAGAITLHANSVAMGQFLGKTSMAMQDGAHLSGRALPQTGLTLIGNTIIEA